MQRTALDDFQISAKGSELAADTCRHALGHAQDAAAAKAAGIH